MKNIAILGSTGSIGTQALDIARANKDKIKIVALAAGSNHKLLQEQIEEFSPVVAALADKKSADILRQNYNGATQILAGDEALCDVSTHKDADMVLAAMVGFSGVKPTIAAIESKKDIALANKETLVAAGSIIMPKIKEYGVKLLPVDSEHSAIFQSMQGQDRSSIAKILLTASGGPFRGKKKEELLPIKVADCLKHPNWSMGTKITIDSSTLANKGLEVIEAYWLFGIGYDDIQVVVHPQSIIHSMVEYKDGAVIAQLGLPDMKVPIQYAFSYPDRWTADFDKIDFFKLASMTFEQPDTETFPALALAFTAGRLGGDMPCVYNGANEQAVNNFINGKISYLDISKAIKYAMDKHAITEKPSLSDIINSDDKARRFVDDFTISIN